MKIFSYKQIYASARSSKAWNIIKGEHDVRIVTLVYELGIWKFHLFRIEQFIPFCKKPFYDGDYRSNESIAADALEEKAKANKWINEYMDK